VRKGAVESQTKELYSDLMATRVAAVTQGSAKRVILTPTTFTLISSAVGGPTAASRAVKTFAKPITWSGKTSGVTTLEIIFDERGMLGVDDLDDNITICVSPSVESAQYDSIVLFVTRVHLGKVVFEGECKGANVTVN